MVEKKRKETDDHRYTTVHQSGVVLQADEGAFPAGLDEQVVGGIITAFKDNLERVGYEFEGIKVGDSIMTFNLPEAENPAVAALVKSTDRVVKLHKKQLTDVEKKHKTNLTENYTADIEADYIEELHGDIKKVPKKEFDYGKTKIKTEIEDILGKKPTPEQKAVYEMIMRFTKDVVGEDPTKKKAGGEIFFYHPEKRKHYGLIPKKIELEEGKEPPPSAVNLGDAENPEWYVPEIQERKLGLIGTIKRMLKKSEKY